MPREVRPKHAQNRGRVPLRIFFLGLRAPKPIRAPKLRSYGPVGRYSATNVLGHGGCASCFGAFSKNAPKQPRHGGEMFLADACLGDGLFFFFGGRPFLAQNPPLVYGREPCFRRRGRLPRRGPHFWHRAWPGTLGPPLRSSGGDSKNESFELIALETIVAA